eukprot:TRINITY_DN6285_c0_g1_i2.p1 TRINITY_DN6285_c0_g1~~TRINITY_DN6285_c0_g1_i2.p1  ORF type:complete len:167 (-),score=20.26 TRINITY_DN6285_c0_g1_i2:114-614(-)
MGNATDGCGVQLAATSADCTKTMKSAALQGSECLAPELCHLSTGALTDQECANILLVNACIRGQLADVQRALGLGASPNTFASLSLKMGDVSKGRKRKGDASHVTPVMRACEMGHEDVVEFLLNARASPAQCDSKGWSPMCLYFLLLAKIRAGRSKRKLYRRFYQR